MLGKYEKKRNTGFFKVIGRHDNIFVSVGRGGDDDERDETEESTFSRNIQKINRQPREGNTGRSRYALQFFQESKEELRQRREDARRAIEPVPLEEQEVSDNYFPPEVDLPKRPPWDFSMSKEQLDNREQKYFSVRTTIFLSLQCNSAGKC